ncbi:MAG: DUF418 domain-containing protein [Actinomycetota bacterium]
MRDIAPDVLRGFALLGILVVNIQFMGLDSEEGARGEWLSGGANGTAGFIMAAIFAGKFYLLFSFLYGYSSAYIIKDDRANRGRWIRRCFALMLFGALHFTFLWHGDIIFLYGLLGLLLLAFFFKSDRTLKIWTRVTYIVSAVFISLIGILLLIGERYFPQETTAEVMEPRLNEVLRDGAFLEAIGPRLELWVFGLVTGIFLQGGMAFAAFLLGVRLARNKFLTSPIDRVQNSRMIKRGFVFGLPIQIAAASVMVRNEQSVDPSEALYLCCLFLTFLAAPLLSMAYVGLIRKLVEDKVHLVAWMKPAGQLSLTVYISQSVITSLIFGPWGLGLFQELETWSVLILAIAIWLLLVALSNLWLKRFNQGPLEKVLGVLTGKKGLSTNS